MTENDLAKIVVDTAFKAHTALGPGLLESVYETVLAHQLTARGLQVRRQVPIAIEYDGMRFEEAFRADLLVEDLLIVEIKSVEATSPVHKKQLLTYLRLSHRKLGLLINFGAPLIKDGITRIVNGLDG
jgi:GxxExxY protein